MDVSFLIVVVNGIAITVSLVPRTKGDFLPHTFIYEGTQGIARILHLSSMSLTIVRLTKFTYTQTIYNHAYQN